jgi:hypothetical protein
MCGTGTQTVLLFLVFSLLCVDSKLVQTTDEKKEDEEKVEATPLVIMDEVDPKTG